MRLIEFLLIAVFGFAIYLVYVEREGTSAHFVYLVAVVTAAAANTLMLQVFNLYRVPAFTAFARRFTRIAFAWSMVIVGMMSLAFFIKVGADFSRVWIATWYAAVLGTLFAERFALSFMARAWIKHGRLYRRAVIAGGGPEAEELIKALEASNDTAYASPESSTIAALTAYRPSSGATRSSAISTSSSSSRGPPASTISSWRCRSRPRSACWNS